MSELTVTRLTDRGMISLRGDLSDDALRSACTGLSGGDFPEAGHAIVSGDKGLLWMSPDEVLILLPQEEVGQALETLGSALAGSHHLAVDVSDARALFRLEGSGLRDTLQKLTPADLSPATFGPGRIRRTRLAQVAAALWMPGEGQVDLVCFRSVADYVQRLLEVAAEGGPVGFHPA
ncbi:sarcosine oxidase subunit gamma [Histidinibacterium aquaticum]|uniref:Sarcosine oxidase subunit gamma n=1 Tax=Histidinibacterium aquaticum TaxID=2613962 RepID=A0A5J5GP33_9RHOB|nr:sarcosine oxidase subunit gamma family protein [Histidinibacterium aquaticum]KAA9009328.1 sarcosine oxidase subunit gamma [Histidinibacterium aquaticum]